MRSMGDRHCLTSSEEEAALAARAAARVTLARLEYDVRVANLGAHLGAKLRKRDQARRQNWLASVEVSAQCLLPNIEEHLEIDVDVVRGA